MGWMFFADCAVLGLGGGMLSAWIVGRHRLRMREEMLREVYARLGAGASSRSILGGTSWFCRTCHLAGPIDWAMHGRCWGVPAGERHPRCELPLD